MALSSLRSTGLLGGTREGGATAPLTGLFGGTREGGACTLAEGYTPALADDLWSSLRTSMDGCSWADAADSF